MRIAVLCNDRLGLPALQQLAQAGLLVAAGTSDRSPEMIAIMQQVSEQAGVPTRVFTQSGLDAQLLDWLQGHVADVVFVKTFPYRIPSAALRLPRFGFVNFHYAPLPGWRGPNPLFWMIRQGATGGGVVAHRMDDRFDTGPVLMTLPVELPAAASFGMCVTHLAHAGALLTARLIQGLAAGTVNETAQQPAEARWHRRPVRDDFVVRWQHMDADSVLRLVRACNPWQRGAIAHCEGWFFHVADASRSPTSPPVGTAPGTIVHLSPESGCLVVCADETMIKIEVIITEEGAYPGAALSLFGLSAGKIFN